MQAFISYSFQDQKIMNKLKTTLLNDGINYYVAAHDENYGDSLSDKLESEIDNSDCVIVILTRNSESSLSIIILGTKTSHYLETISPTS